jgi:hypothetical protein
MAPQAFPVLTDHTKLQSKTTHRPKSQFVHVSPFVCLVDSRWLSACSLQMRQRSILEHVARRWPLLGHRRLSKADEGPRLGHCLGTLKSRWSTSGRMGMVRTPNGVRG